jgi:predicted molibdopterin-dependent oxidoreductase YjgC
LHSCDLRKFSAEAEASTARFKGQRRQYEKDFTHPNIVFEPGKCISCGRCVAIAAKAGEKLGVAFHGRGFTMRIKVPFDESTAAGLTVAARDCADHCPTAALSWRE